MSPLERRLLQSTFFLIPTNLAYHWYINEAYWHGFLIDYLIPRLYLSDLPILILLTLWLIRKKINLIQLSTHHSSLVALFAYLLFTSLIAPRPIAALWLWFKLIELSLFCLYLISLTLPILSKLLYLPLLAGLIFQSIVSLVQYIKQSSVIGYIFFGESHLDTTSAIAKDTLSGVLKILPYGTTPHPNVLAGFVTTGILLLLTLTTYKPKKNILLNLNIFAICLLLLILLLTRSQGALFSVSICLTFFLLYHYRLLKLKTVNLYLGIFSTLIAIVILGLVYYHSQLISDNISIARRYRLISTSLQTWTQSPLMGTGLNQSIPMSSQVNLITTPAPFLQPVHSIYLLWITETGIVGTLLLLWVLIKQRLRLQKRLLTPFILPLLNLVLIGGLDHYPLTLQPGQLLLTLCIAFVFTR